MIALGEKPPLVLERDSSARCADDSTATTIQMIATATITPIGTTRSGARGPNWSFRLPLIRSGRTVPPTVLPPCLSGDGKLGGNSLQMACRGFDISRRRPTRAIRGIAVNRG